MDLEQYISSLSFKSSLLAKEVVRCRGWQPQHVQGLQVCQDPPAWTSVVQVALYGVLMLVVLQENSGVSYKRPLFLTIFPFLTIRVRIKEGHSISLCCERFRMDILGEARRTSW